MPTIWQKLFGMKGGATAANDISSIVSNPLVKVLAGASAPVQGALNILGMLQTVAALPVDDAPVPPGPEPTITFTATEWAAFEQAVNATLTQLGAPTTADAAFDQAFAANLQAAGFDVPTNPT